jgi:hypothetical protein
MAVIGRCAPDAPPWRVRPPGRRAPSDLAARRRGRHVPSASCDGLHVLQRSAARHTAGATDSTCCLGARRATPLARRTPRASLDAGVSGSGGAGVARRRGVGRRSPRSADGSARGQGWPTSPMRQGRLIGRADPSVERGARSVRRSDESKRSHQRADGGGDEVRPEPGPQDRPLEHRRPRGLELAEVAPHAGVLLVLDPDGTRA